MTNDVMLLTRRRDEHLLSEIFLIATSVKNIKKELELRLPHKQPPSDLFNVEMLWKQVEADEWQDKEFESSVSPLIFHGPTPRPERVRPDNLQY